MVEIESFQICEAAAFSSAKRLFVFRFEGEIRFRPLSSFLLDQSVSQIQQHGSVLHGQCIETKDSKKNYFFYGFGPLTLQQCFSASFSRAWA